MNAELVDNFLFQLMAAKAMLAFLRERQKPPPLEKNVLRKTFHPFEGFWIKDVSWLCNFFKNTVFSLQPKQQVFSR